MSDAETKPATKGRLSNGLRFRVVRLPTLGEQLAEIDRRSPDIGPEFTGRESRPALASGCSHTSKR